MSITFKQKSIQEYGTSAKASLLRQANPGQVGAFVEGVIIIPTAPDVPADAPQEMPADSENEVALLIDGERFRFWSDMVITRTLDSVDTVDIKAPFSVDVPEFKTAFAPFSYKDMSVTVGGEVLFTGTMVAVNPAITDSEKTVTVSGYAKCGVLNDVNPPASALPLEFNNQDLKAIASRMCEPFGISVVFDVEPGATFERVACDPGRRVLDFLTELAQQRGLIMTSAADGSLVFYTPTDNPPVARFEQGYSPLTGVAVQFSPQDYYSHITGLESAEAGKAGAQFTVKNPHVTEGVRPFNFSVTDADGPDVETATKAKAGRMMGNMAAYTLDLSTWRDLDGKLWTPGDTVTLTAPDVLVYTEYQFIIRAVTLTRDSSSMTASLELAMPGAFNGVIPETLPWATS